MNMIRVLRGKEARPGIFEYTGRITPGGTEFEGKSRQPLLDACRKIKSLIGQEMGIPQRVRIGLFREGKDNPDVSCGLQWGASHTIVERDRDGLVIEKFEPMERIIDKRAV